MESEKFAKDAVFSILSAIHFIKKQEEREVLQYRSPNFPNFHSCLHNCFITVCKDGKCFPFLNYYLGYVTRQDSSSI